MRDGSSDIAVRLESAKAGIICLTPGNLHSDWILFEAGALSKTIQKTYVCPLLIDLEPTDVKGPLAQFQAARVVKGDVLKLIKTLNCGLDQDALSDGHIEEAFEVWWPKLDSQLKTLPAEGTSAQPPRTDRDVLEEILGFVRNQNRDPVTALPDEDKWVILNSRAWKALRAVHKNVGGAINRLASSGSDIRFDIKTSAIDGKPRTYTLAVPAEATPDEIEASVLSQVKEAERLTVSLRRKDLAAESVADYLVMPKAMKLEEIAQSVETAAGVLSVIACYQKLPLNHRTS